MADQPPTIDAYLAGVPDERLELVNAIRRTIRDHCDPAIEEGMQYGMLGFYVPHSVYPAGYHCDAKQPLPFAGIANRKQAVSFYLFGLYMSEGDHERFVAAWQKTGHKLDMGKSCVRVKKLESTPLDVIGKAVKRMTLRRFIRWYEASRPSQ